MAVLLLAWLASALLLGVLIGTAIHRADLVERRQRLEHPPTTSRAGAAGPGAVPNPAAAGRTDTRQRPTLTTVR